MTQPLNYGVQGDRPYSAYYQHSNNANLVGVILGLAGGAAAGVVAAVIYAYAIAYVPLIYANVICVVGFGLVLGIVPSRIMRWGKVRNVSVALTVVTVATALAYVAHWYVWIYIGLNRGSNNVEFATLISHPLFIFPIISAVYENGTWGLSSGAQVSGIFLALVWICEAAVIFGMAIVIAKGAQTEIPFCETCDAWCRAGVMIRTVANCDANQLQSNMEAKNWTFFGQVGAKSAGAAQWISVIHHGCPTCNRLHTLSATSNQITVDKNGKATTKTKIVVNKLLVEPKDVDAVRGFQMSGPADARAEQDRSALALEEMTAEPPRDEELPA